MSYTVKVLDINIPWVKNAMNNAWNKHFNAMMLAGHHDIGPRCWSREYSSKIVVMNKRDDEFDLNVSPCEITFKDEQEYVMFLLRWS